MRRLIPALLLFAACAGNDSETSGTGTPDTGSGTTPDVASAPDAAEEDVGEAADTVGTVDTATEEPDTAVADVAATDVAATDVAATDVAPTFPPAPERLGGERPAVVNLPPDYSPDKAWPLVLLLHGYSANGLVQDAYLGISKRAAIDGVIVVVPDGTVDAKGNQFWNATDGCCNRNGSPVDDVAYLTGLVAEAKTYFHVDPKRVFSMGHSNGGFMSYRLACDHSELFAGVVVLAGAMWKDTASCPATEPVSVLHVHGTADETILFDGHLKYPSTADSVADWVAFDSCDTTATSGPPLDLDITLDGAETTVERWSGCSAGSAVELWTIVDGAHLPGFADESFAKNALAFLLAHPKP